MRKKENIVTLFNSFRPATIPFLDKAAEKAGVRRAKFIRDAAIAAAERGLGKKAPEVEEFVTGGGNAGLFSAAAEKQGLTVEQLKSKLATEALGGTWVPRTAAKAVKATKRAKK